MIDIKVCCIYALAMDFIIQLSNPNAKKKSPCFLPLYIDNQCTKTTNAT